MTTPAGIAALRVKVKREIRAAKVPVSNDATLGELAILLRLVRSQAKAKAQIMELRAALATALDEGTLPGYAKALAQGVLERTVPK